MLNKLESFYHAQIEPYLSERVLVVSIVIILLLFLLVVRSLRRRWSPIRVFKTTSGRVQVTRSAIRDLVLNACHYVQAARKPKVVIKARRGRLYIRVDLKLNEDQRLSDVAVQLQTRIEDVLQDTLSLDRRSVRIDVGLKGIRHVKTPASEQTQGSQTPITPVPDVAPVKNEEDAVISTADEPEEGAVAVAPAETPEEPEEKEDEPKSKRGFLGFGRRKSEPEAEEEKDPTESDYDADDDPFAPSRDTREDEEKKL